MKTMLYNKVSRSLSRIKAHLILFVFALTARAIYLLLLPDSLFRGVGGQIWPAYVGRKYGIQTEAFDTASVPIALDGRARWARANPDFGTYTYPFSSTADCLKKSDFRNASCLLNLCEYRLPGVGSVYGVIYFLSGCRRVARDAFILVQIVIGAIASVLLGDLVGRLTKSKFMMIIASISYAFFPFVVRYEFILGSEGMYASFIIFYVFLLYVSSFRPNLYLLLSSISLLLALLYRPITILFYPATLAAFIIVKTNSFKNSLIFLTPFLIFEAFWLPCNLIRNHSLSPVSSRLYGEGIETSEWGRVNFLLSSYGDNYYWFYYSKYSFPKRSFTTKFDSTRADSVKSLIQKFYQGSERVTEGEVVRILIEWEYSIKREKPFLYFVSSRIYSFWNFITSHIQEHLFYTPITEGGHWYFALYMYSMIMWIFTVFIGGIACIYYLWNFRQNIFYALLSLNALLGIASYTYLKQIQSRYLLISIPLLLILACAFTYGLYRQYVRRNKMEN